MNSDRLNELEENTNRFLGEAYVRVGDRLAAKMLSRAKEGDSRAGEVIRLADKLGLQANPSELFIADDVREVVWQPIAQSLVIGLVRYLAQRGESVARDRLLAERNDIIEAHDLARRTGLDEACVDVALGETIDEVWTWLERDANILIDEQEFIFRKQGATLHVHKGTSSTTAGG